MIDRTMELQSFQEALGAKDLQVGGEYAIHGTIAHAMNWGDIKNESVQRKISRALQPVKEPMQNMTGITKGSRWSPSRATLETIVTKIFPLLVPKHPTLQYWIDMWHRDHPQDDSTHRSVSPDPSDIPSNSNSHDVTDVNIYQSTNPKDD